MKKSELCFKVLSVTCDRGRAIQEALFAKGFLEGKEIATDCAVICCDRGMVSCSYQPEAIISRERLPEVTYQQALDLIAQVEPEKEGEFVECDVDANGMFYVSSRKGCRQKTYWSNVASVECNSCMELVFAGWQWKGEDGFLLSTRRQGFDFNGKLNAEEFAWKKPAQPVAVRFWRKNK